MAKTTIDRQQDRTKREFLDEWVRAVNNHGGFGQWAWAVSKNPADLKGILKTYSDEKR
jgi:type III restriction enzyme